MINNRPFLHLFFQGHRTKAAPKAKRFRPISVYIGHLGKTKTEQPGRKKGVNITFPLRPFCCYSSLWATLTALHSRSGYRSEVPATNNQDKTPTVEPYFIGFHSCTPASTETTWYNFSAKQCLRAHSHSLDPDCRDFTFLYTVWAYQKNEEEAIRLFRWKKIDSSQVNDQSERCC